MIGSTRQVTVYAFSQPADLRRGYDGLSALVRQAMGRDELSGDLYLFVSRTRRRAKVLLWDGTGLCVYAKRLECGRFACLWSQKDAPQVRLTVSELQLFLEGSKLVGRVALSQSFEEDLAEGGNPDSLQQEESVPWQEEYDIPF